VSSENRHPDAHFHANIGTPWIWAYASQCQYLRVCQAGNIRTRSNVGTCVAHGNCNTWAMNAVLNSMHLSLATSCTLFLVNPFLRNTWHMVLPDTITPVASYIAWHISRKYRDGFSCIVAIMNSSWWPSSFHVSSLRGCFSGATFSCVSEPGKNAVCSTCSNL